MPIFPLSPSITPPELIWPFDTEGQGLQLALAGFDPARFGDSDFARHGVALPAALTRAVTKRRAEYLAGRLCARTALEALGIAPGPLERLADRQVAWPAAARGAITHSRNLAGALVAGREKHRGVGLDAEQWLTPERAAYLSPSILIERERKRLAALAPVPFARAVTLAFSLKESLFKALYPLTGVRFYFHDACVEELEATPAGGACRLILRCDLTPEWPAGSVLEGVFCECRGQALTAVLIKRT